MTILKKENLAGGFALPSERCTLIEPALNANY